MTVCLCCQPVDPDCLKHNVVLKMSEWRPTCWTCTKKGMRIRNLVVSSKPAAYRCRGNSDQGLFRIGVDMELKRLRLGRNEERRLGGGHLWIYSNEVDNAATPLKSFAPGEQVVVESHNGKKM